MPDLQQAVDEDPQLDLELHTHVDPVKGLLEDGRIVPFWARNRTEYTTPVDSATLADVLAFAERCVVKDLRGRRGRRPSDTSRAIEAINPRLFGRMKTVCRNIARHLARPGEGEDDLEIIMQRVGTKYFAWDPTAGDGGQGDWRRFLELVAASASPSNQDQDVGTGRKLLDLAATHHWIRRTPRHDEDYLPVPAVWADTYNDWRDEIEGLTDRPRLGLMELLAACRRVQIDPERADAKEWRHVTEHLEEHFNREGWPSRKRTSVRSTYRALLTAEVIEGPEWDAREYREETRTTLISQPAIRAIAELYGREGERTGIASSLTERTAGWPECARLQAGLRGGTYGLERWLLYQTVTTSEADALDLPLRGVYPRDAIRRPSRKGPVAWRTATARGALRKVFYYAGWLAEHRGVDWSTSDLRELLSWDHVSAFRRAVLAEEACAVNQFARLVGVLGRLASPYLEAVALRLGDEELADQMAHVSARLTSPTAVDGKPSLKTQLDRDREEGDIERMKRKARMVESAWTRDQSLADTAYEQLEKVGRLLIQKLEQEHGALADQAAEIVAGSHMPHQWAKDLQDALYWHDQLVVPLRSRTSRLLVMGERLADPDLTRIHAKIPRWKLKEGANGAFRPNYALPGGTAYCRDLYRLHVMPGGAREVLRTTKEGIPRMVDAFYVPDVQNGNLGRRRLTYKNVRSIIKRAVTAAEEVTGVPFQEIHDAGGLGTHFFRHAFATAMVRVGLIELAALYLHHSDTTMLRRVYAAVDESHFDAGEQLRQARANAS